MTDAEKIVIADLVLEGRVARIPITFRGGLENGRLGELSGCVDIDRSLIKLLEDLGGAFDQAAKILKQISGGKIDSFRIQRLAVGYRNGDPKSAQIVVTMAAGKSSYRFAIVKLMGPEGGFLVGLDLKWDQSLFGSNILSGLVGDICLDELGIYYASRPCRNIRYDPDRDFQEGQGLPALLPDIEGRTFNKGLNISAQILVGGINLLDWFAKIADQMSIQAVDQNAGQTASADASDPSGNNETQLSTLATHWIEVDKTVGPFTVKRIGLTYDAPRVGILFDGGVQLGVLTLALIGFGMSYPLNEISTDPREIIKKLKFNLDGASVCLDMGAVMIGGALMKVGDTPLRLDGTLVVRVGTLTIGAIGSYTSINGWPSLFVFAALQQPLGGPPYFFIMGIAGGFGLNRSLTLPPISDVHNFPLVRAATDPDYLGKELDLRVISQKISDYISPSTGNFWLAAGLKFTSFIVIDVFALASVSIGTGFEIALLGLARLQLPKQLPGAPIRTVMASVEMALKVAFSPFEGLVSVEARLTENSYILLKEIKLRGGFAFYLWFAGPHMGNFVVSIGGYHPRFQPPAYYPRPDLVEFGAKMGPVTIKGNCYFTLCPTAIMAGGGFNITFQTAVIKAWFIAHADFLLQWKPLYYDVDIGITVGVALNLNLGFVRVNLSFELGASVNLYGPPLGGKARISLWIISFTVPFGQAKSTPPALRWESDDPEKSFAKAFLPNPKVTRINVSDGLLAEINTDESTVRLVNPHKLVVRCTTVVPAMAIRFNRNDYTHDSKEAAHRVPQPTINGESTKLGIRPMGQSSYFARLDIDLKPDGAADPAAVDYLNQYLDTTLVTQSVPPAMWGDTALDTRQPPKAHMIDDALMGLEIRTKPGPRPWETPVLDLEVLAYARSRIGVSRTTAKPAEGLPAYGDKTIANTIEAEDVAARRRNVIDVLIKTGRKVVDPQQIHLDQLKENAELIFQDMPAMARVGQYPPRGYLET